LKEAEIRTKLVDVMATILDVAPAMITEDCSMDTIGHWDSLKHMKLVIALEQEFGIEFDDADVVEMLNFRLIELTLQRALKI